MINNSPACLSHAAAASAPGTARPVQRPGGLRRMPAFDLRIWSRELVPVLIWLSGHLSFLFLPLARRRNSSNSTGTSS